MKDLFLKQIDEFVENTVAEDNQSNNFIRPKENTMAKDSLDVEVKINGEVVSASKKTKQKTDLQLYKKHKIFAIYFDVNGNEVNAQTFKTEAEATQLLATPAYVGCTVLLYKQTAAKRQKLQLEDC